MGTIGGWNLVLLLIERFKAVASVFCKSEDLCSFRPLALNLEALSSEILFELLSCKRDALSTGEKEKIKEYVYCLRDIRNWLGKRNIGVAELKAISLRMRFHFNFFWRVVMGGQSIQRAEGYLIKELDGCLAYAHV